MSINKLLILIVVSYFMAIGGALWMVSVIAITIWNSWVSPPFWYLPIFPLIAGIIIQEWAQKQLDEKMQKITQAENENDTV